MNRNGAQYFADSLPAGRKAVAVVTGGGTGIGRATCRRLAASDVTVAVAGNVETEIVEVSQTIQQQGGRAVPIAVDVTRPDELGEVSKSLDSEFGGVDILVTSAGVMGARSFITDTSDVDWLRTMEVNLNAGFYCLKAFLPGMLERDLGRVVMISSTSGKLPAAKNADYAASKHGVIGLVKALAVELGILRKAGITANAICPGSVDTAMIDAIVEPMATKAGVTRDQFVQDHVASKNLQRRLLEADEVASMVAYLVSEGARGVTGQAMNVCAGTVLY